MDFKSKKKSELIDMLDCALGWIFDHCAEDYDYVSALDYIGFSREDAESECANACIENAESLLNQVYES